MEIKNFSDRFDVRKLFLKDAEIVYNAIKDNNIFYQYHPPVATVESIISDMKALPPNKGYEDKYYIGFFKADSLIAVMDLIKDYPEKGTALIGFFAMNTDFQGKGIGSIVISDSIAYLKQLGFKKVRLGIDKGNPQSKAFWSKNGFILNGEEFPNGFSSFCIMERIL